LYLLAVGVVAAVAAACPVQLETIIRMPVFRMVDEPRSQVRLFGPTAAEPLGGAALRVWTRVANPNPFSVTMTRVEGDVFLAGTRAAGVQLPLGLPLVAGQDTVIPLDFRIGFADLPGLAETMFRAATGEEVHYRLDGTVAVDAGVLGQPTFGPTMLMQGTVVLVR
jgi:hypothetical protein